MPLLELPHTANCLVCGRSNPHGLHLSLHVDASDGSIHTRFTPTDQHIGFESIAHGGVLATVLDEAMVWAATWKYRRFCLCAEMNVRFLRPAIVGEEMTVVASVASFRPRLATTTAQILDSKGQLLAEGSGKYMPMPETNHRAVVTSFVKESVTDEAARILSQG
ncbi:MAG TPA: PaaI family thioesterase [Tepidisphaeraceae bacterium]|nr:PaaI family thioesterase [Tepidisphaeraceae bacterium]